MVPGIIRGTLLDATTAEPLIGANVMIEGTTSGASTDLDGQFSLKPRWVRMSSLRRISGIRKSGLKVPG
ncbi:MAG: carboxypeptidase-like regulatory domain-containing protein [Saprospiraceae bacterium]|nr:carboxypeptidase-like regulatory domain-containing protein [Saprospiraceae bacterium]